MQLHKADPRNRRYFTSSPSFSIMFPTYGASRISSPPLSTEPVSPVLSVNAISDSASISKSNRSSAKCGEAAAISNSIDDCATGTLANLDNPSPVSTAVFATSKDALKPDPISTPLGLAISSLHSVLQLQAGDSGSEIIPVLVKYLHNVGSCYSEREEKKYFPIFSFWQF